MVALRNHFDANNVEPDTPFDPLPNGDYDVMIMNTSEKPTAKRDGSFIEIEMQVEGGQFNGRKLWDRLNLNNASQKAVEIAERQLSAICHATGVMNLTDTEQLHGRMVRCRVVVDNEPGYAPKNVVKGYKKPEGNGGGQGGGRPGYGGQGGYSGGQQGGRPGYGQQNQRPQNNGQQGYGDQRGGYQQNDQRGGYNGGQQQPPQGGDRHPPIDDEIPYQGDNGQQGYDDRGGYDQGQGGYDQQPPQNDQQGQQGQQGGPSGQPQGSTPPWRSGRR
ncbi:DUF669 domain-containing protein [Salipiger pacificus]|nr:DUF669 domain-containing protein [Alloyangia pacifica]